MNRTGEARHAGIAVRPATAGDLVALQEVYRRASLSNPGDREALLGSPDALVWEGAGLASGLTRVAMDDERRFLGFATLVPFGAGFELEDLFVDPDHMRQGVATRLMAALTEDAVARGAAWIEVTANPHAAEFYASAGFEPVGREQTRFGDAPRLRWSVTLSMRDDARRELS
jgi:GNAT superfamily N-acetyltransferase